LPNPPGKRITKKKQCAVTVSRGGMRTKHYLMECKKNDIRKKTHGGGDNQSSTTKAPEGRAAQKLKVGRNDRSDRKKGEIETGEEMANKEEGFVQSKVCKVGRETG